MNNNNSIPFHLLSASLVLAAFLPMLAYTYSKSLIDEINKELEMLEKSSLGKDDKKRKANQIKENADRSFYFYSAMDFIVTEGAYLVLLSGLLGLTIYLSPSSHLLIPYFVVYLYLAFFNSIHRLIKYYIQDKVEEKRPWYYALRDGHYYLKFLCAFFKCKICKKDEPDSIKSNTWPDYWKYGLLFYTLIIVYVVAGIIYHRSSKVIISITSLFLIIFAVAWILPSVCYTPLWLLKKNTSRKLNKFLENDSTIIS